MDQNNRSDENVVESFNAAAASTASLESFHTALEVFDQASTDSESRLHSVATNLLGPEVIHLPELQVFKFDLFLAVLGCLLSLFDWGSDIWMSASHFMRGNNLECGLTIGIVIGAGMLSFLRFKYKGSLESIRFELYPDSVRVDIHRQNLMSPEGPEGGDAEIYCFLRYHDALLEQTQFYKSMETVFESGPQVILQLYIFMFRVQQATFLGGLEAGVTILLSLSSIASCARGNYMSKFNIHQNSPPLVVKIFLHVFSMFNYFFRTVASMAGFVCVLLGFLLFSTWYLAGLLTLLLIIIPRLSYLSYDVITALYYQKHKIPSFSDIGIYYIVEQTVVTLVCSGPTQRKASSAIGQSRFEMFLFTEPVAHLALWGLLQYFLNSEITLMFILVFSSSVIVFYVFHFLSNKVLLRWTLNTVKYWEQCNFIIASCEAILRELKSGIYFGSRHDKRLQRNLLCDEELLVCYNTQLRGQDSTEMVKSLIDFYKKGYNSFDEPQLRGELLEKNRHIQVLLEITMIKLTHHLLSVPWNEEDENYMSSVVCVLSYLRYKSIEWKKEFEKLGSYYKYFRDGRQQFRCQGLIYEFNQKNMPRLTEKLMYGFVDGNQINS